MQGYCVKCRTKREMRSTRAITMKNGKPAKVNEIAKNQNMPERFLEQAMASLKKDKLVKSIRGAHGGYILADKPEKITLGKVIAALEGQMALANCLKSKNGCLQTDLCTIRDVWKDVQEVILESLESITLKQIIDRELKKANTGRKGRQYA